MNPLAAAFWVLLLLGLAAYVLNPDFRTIVNLEAWGLTHGYPAAGFGD